MSTNFLVFGVFYVILMLMIINVFKGIHYRTLVFLVVLSRNVFSIFQFNLLLFRYVGFKSQFTF
jgi:hypothetical protein